MAYQLESMLRIRTMREDRAGTELTGARRARTAAERTRNEKAAAQTAYEEHREERRDKVFDAVIGRVVSMDDLDRARDAVSKIDEEGVLLAEATRRAQTELDEREVAAETAHRRYVAATKDRVKIDQHKLAWEEEDRRMQEQRSDAEMEEFVGRKMTSDDDDTFD